MKLLVISVTEPTPQNRVSDAITHVTLNTISGVCSTLLTMYVLISANYPKHLV